MTLLFDLNKALYLRFRSLMVLVEGESEITHISSVLLLSLFHLCIFFLAILVFDYAGIPFAKFSGDFMGKILTALSTLMLVALNLVVLRRRIQCLDSIFIKGEKPTFVTDFFIVTVIFLMVVFSYLNDHL